MEKLLPRLPGYNTSFYLNLNKHVPQQNEHLNYKNEKIRDTSLISLPLSHIREKNLTKIFYLRGYTLNRHRFLLLMFRETRYFVPDLPD